MYMVSWFKFQPLHAYITTQRKLVKNFVDIMSWHRRKQVSPINLTNKRKLT